MSRPDSINDLIERYLDEVAPPSDVGLLQDRLRTSEADADAFAEAILFDALLQGAYAEKSNLVDEAFSAVVAGDAEPAGWFAAFAPATYEDEPFAEPAPGLLGGALRGTSNYFQLGGMPFAYLTSTVVLVMIMLIGSVVHVARDGQYADGRAPRVAGVETADPANRIVGRITAMSGVKWSEDAGYLPPLGFASVPLGRKYSLAAGLMEITYDTGAKVILEGPCEYTANSPAGGFLKRGKLVAKVEKVASGQWPVAGKEGRGERGEGRVKSEEGGVKSGKWRVESKKSSSDPDALAAGEKLLATSHRPLATNPQPPAPSPQSSLSTLHSPLFTISTPTALVTDLGTEFGVEVSDEGDTVSHVFRGSVKVQVVCDDKQEVLLKANESARVGRVRETHQGATAHELVRLADPAPKFVRSIMRAPARIDLLDIVAGGYGTSGRRGRGIDPASGRYAATPVEKARDGDGQYWPIAWNRMIDGVFVPRDGKTQLDSAGHSFDGFSGITGRTYGNIWSREADADPNAIFDGESSWTHEIADAGRFMPEGRGLLVLHANAGITFDLQEVRLRHRGSHPNRLTAIIGLTASAKSEPSIDGTADFRAFIDGRVKYERLGFGRRDGTVRVEVEIGPDDRFLTLAATDAGDGITADWFVVGDPILETSAGERQTRDKQVE